MMLKSDSSVPEVRVSGGDPTTDGATSKGFWESIKGDERSIAVLLFLYVLQVRRLTV